MVIDSATIITGSFNFTKAAEAKNAENLLVIKEAYELVRLYETNIATHAAHARPYTRPKAAATEGPVQGNPQSKIYHVPGCPGYGSVSHTNRVTFATEAAARTAGYRKAKNCP